MSSKYRFHDSLLEQLARHAEGLRMQVDPTQIPQGDPAEPLIPLNPNYPPQDPRLGQQQPAEQYFTADQIETARRQERDKLYSRLEQGKAAQDELKALKKEREDREAAEHKIAEDAAAAERQRQIEEADAKGAIALLQQDYEHKLAELQQRQDLQNAMWEREREMAALNSYKQEALRANAENILPRLQDVNFLTGATREEIDASVARLVQVTAATMQDMSGAQIEANRAAPGVSTFAPGSLPTEGIGQQTQNLTADQIRNLPMEDYIKLRDRLPLGPSAMNNGRGQGLF